MPATQGHLARGGAPAGSPLFSPPDTVLHGGRIHPRVDGGPPLAAIAIAAGRVVAAGNDDEVLALAGRMTRLVDLAGSTVMPGFIDSHTHFHRAAILRRLFLDFEALRPRSVDDVLRAIRERAAGMPPGAWIQGDSLSPARLAEGRLPDRHELDGAGGGRPVVLRGVGKHVVAASGAALTAAGIDRVTPDPPGGRIERDAAGEPTGILHERAKLRLDASDPATVIPIVEAGTRRAAVRDSFRDLHRLGIVAIHEMVRAPEEADDLAALRAEGHLGVRVRLFYRIYETAITLDHLATLGIRGGLGDDWLRILGVKVSVDGWCIFGNAAVHEPYLGQPGNRGILRIEPAELARLVRAANQRDLGIAVHAVGARAVDAALDAFEAAGPARRGPYRLEHGHLDMDASRLRRMGRLGVTWSVQPSFLEAYRPDWERVLDAGRIARIMPLRQALDLGVAAIHNSDVPSGPQAPLHAIAAASTRAPEGRPIGEEEAIPLLEAWRGWTVNAAMSAGEAFGGCLEPGSRADLIVFERDPLDSTIQDLVDWDVMATMIDGQFVHGTGRFEA